MSAYSDTAASLTVFHMIPTLSYSLSIGCRNLNSLLNCRILFRDYGANCKVVGIADGFGVAEDPNGLDREELLRLVKESLPITSFKKVSDGA
jgi:hypothetical protein